jgi:DNA adenine methylase
MKASNKIRPYRLLHFTPLRYPGGKGKLAAYIKAVIKANRLLDGEYVEPYAGGAAVALELLFHEYVSRVHINDLSRPIFAFWHSVLQHPEQLCKLVKDTPLTMKSWGKQKQIFAQPDDHDDISLGFATFFLNRTNRSGILNGGAIGGKDQAGPWKIDARFNRDELIGRIRAIAKMKNRIRLTSMDALSFLNAGSDTWPQKTLIYLDPPYYAKGRDLYYDFYQHEDHVRVEQYVAENLKLKNWIVSYDNVATIRSLYKAYQQIVYRIGYSARESRQGSEAMFFSETLTMPPLEGPLSLIRTKTRLANTVRVKVQTQTDLRVTKKVRNSGSSGKR